MIVRGFWMGRALLCLGLGSFIGASDLLAPALAQVPLTNGQTHAGAIPAAGESDTFSFSAAGGSGVVIRVGAAGFPPRLRLFGPDNALVAEATATSLASRDVMLTNAAPATGAYTVTVSSANAATGAYALHFALAGAGFEVPAGDQGGELASGARHPGEITLGDLDMWRFNAAEGSSFHLRMGASFPPAIRIFGPDGRLVGEALSGSTGTRDVVISGMVSSAGAHTVVVNSTVLGGTGNYSLHLVAAPGAVAVSEGDQGGALSNGVRASGQIDVGDLDAWHFEAGAGDLIDLRMGGSFPPSIRVYGPGGAVAGEVSSVSTGTRDVALSLRATDSGTHIAVVSSTTSGGDGAYELNLARLPGSFETGPGDEGGPLTNGVPAPGAISVGDLDLWSFEAQPGDALILRLGAGFAPRVELFGPDGELLGETAATSSGGRDVELEARAEKAGRHTVVASSAVFGASGAYALSLARAPGEIGVLLEDGGWLTSGLTHAATILVGDLDLWQFEASAGESIFLRMAGEFAPSIRVFDPLGQVAGVAESISSGTRDLWLSLTATNAGVYTVVTASTVLGGDGSYNLQFVSPLAGVSVSPGDEGGTLRNGATNLAMLPRGDVDAWSFHGTVGDSNVFRLTATNFSPWLRLYGPAGTLVAESAPPSSGTRSATLIYELTNNPGPHVLVVSAGVGAQAGSYALKQSRWAPDLEVSGSFTLAEGEALEASLFAQDPDEPGKTLEFAMLAAPPGAVFNVAGPTNAAIDWPTAESTGPSTNLFVVSVADTVNGRTFRRTNAFSVVVQEINVAPVLTVPPSLAIDELAPWSVQVSAEDADLPPNLLAFSLLSPPAGMSIDPATGWIDWSPLEEQGPSTNVVTVVVTDQSPHAANATSLSATNSFVVVVREVNSPPQLVLPPAQTIDELSTWLASVQASDSDLPANSLTLSLVAGPPGLTLDPATGAVRWTPSEAQGPGTNIVTIALADFNADAAGERILAVTNSFAVGVREINTPPQLAVPDLQTVAEGQLLDVSAVATDSDLPANSISYSLAAPPAGAAIDAATGRITWSPAEAQGPSTNLLVVVATDSSPGAANGASMSTTNSFTVIVTEVNEAPVLPAQADRSLAEGSALVVTNTATDADLPAHGLSYRLAAGPASAAVSPAGVITWTPTEADGPGSYVFTTVVADDGLPQRSATNSFVVTVSEVNLPPVLRSIPAQTVRFGSAWSLQAEAEDADLPANTLSFSMVEGPAGLGVQASSGELSWTPAENQIGSHFATLRVADNGSPEGSATIRFEITVTGRQSSLGIQQLANGLIQIRIEGENGVLYRLERSADLVAWEEQVELRLSASPFLYILPDSAGQSRRFFRLRMAQ